MYIFNTLTGKKEEFKPLNPNKIGMYACGVTVYDLCHIGHARSLIVFDIIYRYLQFKGYEVTFVRNFTDIDDKIINRANEEGVDFSKISEKYINEYFTDVTALNIKSPTYEPKATEHIEDMIKFVKGLIEKGYAYNVEGDVFFRVKKFSDYGKLSKKNINDLISGARIEIDSKKEDPLDFVLWKSSKPNEPFWDSPWGKGRPGWHLECSVMSMKYLGETFDIHGGGKDLIFPHHENEIAQSEAYTGKIFANFWIHNGFVNINKEKMSKSLGNFFTIREILDSTSPDVLRFFLLSSHYHKPIDFSEDNLKNARNGFLKLSYSLSKLESLLKDRKPVNKNLDIKGLSKNQKKLLNKFEEFKSNFFEAMDDDFNTAKAIGFVFDFLSDLNKITNVPVIQLNENLLSLLFRINKFFQDFKLITGLFSLPPNEFIENEKKKFLIEKNIDENFILTKIKERENFRKNKKWEKADQIREELQNLGIFLEDTINGTIWKTVNL